MSFEYVQINRIWACEKSQQFEQAVSVFDSMIRANVSRETGTYHALISCAEKVGEWEEAIHYLNEMKIEGVERNTAVYNSAMWAGSFAYKLKFSFLLLNIFNKCNKYLNTSRYSERS